MFAVGQPVKVEYIGGPPPDDSHPDLKEWWVRDYNAVIISIDKDRIIVKDLDASDDLFECTCTLWVGNQSAGNQTVKIHTQN